MIYDKRQNRVKSLSLMCFLICFFSRAFFGFMTWNSQVNWSISRQCIQFKCPSPPQPDKCCINYMLQICNRNWMFDWPLSAKDLQVWSLSWKIKSQDDSMQNTIVNTHFSQRVAIVRNNAAFQTRNSVKEEETTADHKCSSLLIHFSCTFLESNVIMQDRYSEIGFFQQILGLNLVPRKNGTFRGNDTSLGDFSGNANVL